MVANKTENTDSEKDSSKRIMRFAFAFSVIVSGILAVVVVCIPVVASLIDPSFNSIPETIENWGGIVLGYYFGSMIGVFSKAL